jgi:hypothetical protein
MDLVEVRLLGLRMDEMQVQAVQAETGGPLVLLVRMELMELTVILQMVLLDQQVEPLVEL